MIKLKNILAEIESDKIDNISDEIGQKIDDIFKNELNKISQQQNEAILTTAALILSIPSFLKTISKIAESIAKKSGIDLRKKNNETWYKILETFADQIDTYIDTPFNFILKPLIKDNIKRQKIITFLKGVCIVTMAILGSVDLTQSTTLITKIKNIGGEFMNELLQNAVEKNIDKITIFTKDTLKQLI